MRKQKPHLEAEGGPFVYFVRAKTTGLIKIGTSANPYKRLLDMQCGSADSLSIILLVPGSQHEERQLHRRFKSCRERGEWFRFEGVLKKYLENKDLIAEPAAPDAFNSVPSVGVLTGCVRGYATTKESAEKLVQYGLTDKAVWLTGRGAENFDYCLRSFRDRPGWIVLAADLREFGTSKRDISQIVALLEKKQIKVLDITHPEDDTYAAQIQRANVFISGRRLSDPRTARRQGRWGGVAKGRNAELRRASEMPDKYIRRIVNHAGISWEIKCELLEGVCSEATARRHYYGKT